MTRQTFLPTPVTARPGEPYVRVRDPERDLADRVDDDEHLTGDDLDEAGRRVEEASLALVEMTLNAIVEEGDLSVTQLRVLLVVDRHGPLNLSTLAARLGMSISSTGRLVARLDRAGLLTRLLALHSRREITIEVTSRGHQTLQRLRAARRRHIASVLTRLPPDTRWTLARVLLEFTVATRHDEEPRCVH